MKKELLAIVDKFQDKKIIVIGDPMLDEYVYGTMSRVSPEAPVGIVKKEFVYYFPGGAANTANNIRSLEGKPILIGAVGDDANKERLFKVMNDLGISTEFLVIDKSRPTTTKTRIIANNQQVVRIDAESTNIISEELEKEVLNTLKKMITTSDAVILSDYAKGSLTELICREAIRLCRESGKKIIVDPKLNFSKYRGATIITPNEKEFKEYSGISGEYEDSDALKVMDANGFEALLITKGKDGMTLYQKDGKKVDVKALNHGQEVADITGAGDTSIAIFSLALSNGASMEQAVSLANYGAGIVVRKLGTTTTTIEEMKKELERLKE